MATIEQFLAGETDAFGPPPVAANDQRWPTSPRPVRSDPFPRASLFDRRTLLFGTGLTAAALLFTVALGLAFVGMVR